MEPDPYGFGLSPEVRPAHRPGPDHPECPLLLAFKYIFGFSPRLNAEVAGSSPGQPQDIPVWLVELVCCLTLWMQLRETQSHSPLHWLRTDSGRYLCEIINPISSQTALYALEVFYGPENVQISGPKEIQMNKTLILTCLSDSVPTAKYTWIKDGTVLTLSCEYTKTMTGSSDSGEYICRASNQITNETSEASHTVTVNVTDSAVPPEDLSAGAIAGITVALLVVVVGAAVGGFQMYKHQNGRKFRNNSQNEQHVYENTSNTHNSNNDEETVYENDFNPYNRNL
ncbi:carcinoembryonic antigen-related cell adhesion molecule 20-like [Boleophthalmus pectinirostris]|uniref:carcinoembryonic antigen-related cell adhesion molecule 20-like n=1 Tax=Boleophthalmus pectinirostris TaxID=150288 RepID=UPI002430255C|nr:carcinoembryonic antigen-related cell adhesion molecule 20-like [Boleophthalmus pectinirostris]